jgi:hypothetical protein
MKNKIRIKIDRKGTAKAISIQLISYLLYLDLLLFSFVGFILFFFLLLFVAASLVDCGYI